MLLDSNIIIYSAQPENEFLRQLIAEGTPAVSAVSYACFPWFREPNDAQGEESVDRRYALV